MHTDIVKHSQTAVLRCGLGVYGNKSHHYDSVNYNSPKGDQGGAPFSHALCEGEPTGLDFENPCCRNIPSPFSS